METPEQRIRRVVGEEVTIAPYDPAWPALFRREKEHLLSCLPSELIGRIEHFGSTAVPGLAAKPIVDMLVEVTDLEATKAADRPDPGIAGLRLLLAADLGDDGSALLRLVHQAGRQTGVRTHHIHMVERHFPSTGTGFSSETT